MDGSKILKFKRPLIILFYLLMAVLVGAMGDGLNNRSIQDWGHVLDAFEKGILLFAFYIIDEDKKLTLKEVLLMFITYIFIRIPFFDYAYNIAAGNELTYLSHGNFWGRLWLDWFKAPPDGIIWMRCFFLLLGIVIPVKYLK